jgi:subtilisin family serine protease
MKSYRPARRPLHAAIAAAVMLSLGSGYAAAQQSVPVSEVEGTRAWFVELSGAPTADGNNLAAVRNEKAAFRRAAAAAGISYRERMSFDTLFNGLSIEVDGANRAKLTELSGVKAVYPVALVDAPERSEDDGVISPELATAIKMTGADIAQNSRGLTGKGVKVGIIDTGIDIDHPAFGGNGTPGSTTFPTARIVAGWDFVGDAYNADPTSPAFNLTKKPDANPDDCGGHGTHVSGIVGGNGGGIKGVAPGVQFGAYRVFGCAGSTESDNILAALERAYADGMDVVNQSLGAPRQWPQYPTAQATSRMVNKGIVMVASIGNSGPQGGSPDGLFAAGAPGTGAKVIGVASYDNTATSQPAFSASPDNRLFGYNPATGAPPAPKSGTLPIYRTGATAPAIEGCSPANFAGIPAGSAILIRRGTCTFAVKAANAQAAGAAAVILYNNAAGQLNPTVAGAGITIPVVAITLADGTNLSNRIGAGTTTISWTDQTVSTPISTGGLISGFSSFGMAADLTLKPNIGAPGGSIYSSYPLELGGAATLSGTSMSSPHVAGGVALILEANPRASANSMMARLQNSADPKNWATNPTLGLLDHTFRQGAGMLDIIGTLDATTLVEPSQLSLGESEAGPKTRTITVSNAASSPVTYDLSHVAGLAAGPNNACGASSCPASYNLTGPFSAPSTVTFSAPSVTVPAGGSATFDVTIDPNAGLPNRSLYGGYIVLTPQGGGATYRVPFAGLKGDYQATQVLTPTPNGFPWLAKLSGNSFLNQAAGATYTLANDDIPYFLAHFDHLSRRVRFEAFDAVSGRSWHRISDDQYFGRNSTPGGFFSFSWDGTTFTGKGDKANQRYVVPNGKYVVKLSVLKALGDESNPAHWETWTSPVITIARP